jgi:GntR family transcriptional regulator
MLDFENYKQEQGVPIYLQLIGFIKRAVASGSAADGEELPSRRYLSARLGINPNTVQKAFAALELEGLIVSRGGSGSVFTLSEEKIEEVKEEMIREDLGRTVSAMKASGIDLEDAVKMMKEYWEADK